MITDFKKTLCSYIIGDYCRLNKTEDENLTSADIYQQTTLGLSMEYMGMTNGWTQEDFDYLKTRDGIIKTYVDNEGSSFCLTLRDILYSK